MVMTMNEEKGFELLDAKTACEEEYREEQERLMRIQGYGSDADDKIGGFIKRNNVMERL